MKKFNKIFSISLTVAILASMLVTSAIPVGAADNAWSSVAVPTKTGLVMPNTITASGPMAMAIDGTLYAAITNSAETTTTTRLAKSTNGGRTWTSIAVTQGAINAIATSPNEANVLYFAVGNQVFKSADSGATYTSRGTVTGTVSAIGAALVGGSYKLYIGSANGVFFQNEGDFIPAFSTPFAMTDPILALELSPNFATDLGIVVIADPGAQPYVSFSVGSGQFNATVKNVNIGDAATNAASIGLPSNFNGTSSPFFYAGINGTNGGVYRVSGSTVTSSILQLPFFATAQPVVSVDVLGAFAGATVLAGTSNGKAFISTDGGANFTASKKLTGVGATLVALKSDFATSLTAYALQVASAANDQSGFNLSVDGAKNFNQVSLLNDSFTNINDVATNATSTWIATSRTVTGAGGTAAESFTITAGSAGVGAVAADALVITGPTGAGTTATATFTINTGTANVGITTNTTGSASVVGNIIFLGVGDVATIEATSNGTSGTVNVQGSGAATVTMAVTDAETPDDAVVVPPAAFPGVASFNLPDMAVAAVPTYFAGTATITVTAGTITITGATSGNGTYTSVSGAVVVTVDATNTTATVTNSGAAGDPAATGTFPATAPVTPGDPAPTTSVASPFSLATVIGAGGTVVYNSLWRMVGSDWERVRFSGDTAAVNILRLSPNYATDQTVAFTNMGTNNKIMVSNDAGKSFAAQLVAPGGATAVAANTLVLVDKNVFIVGGLAGVVTKTLDNGFTWTNVTIAAPSGGSTGNITSMARSSDSTALVVGTSEGRISRSTDLGGTWTTSTAAVGTAALMVTFQTGSNDVVWGALATGGLFSYNFAATAPAWTSRQDDGVDLFDSAAGNLLVTPMGIASGAAASGSAVTYALNDNGSVVRLLSGATKAGMIAPSADFTAASALFINAAAGANVLTIVSGAKMFTYTDKLAVPVAGVAISSFTTSQATVAWTALTGVDRFAIAIKQSSSADKDLYTAVLSASSQSGTSYTITGLAADTTYSVSVWGVSSSGDDNADTATFAGTVTFSTMPVPVGPPVALAPAVGATGIALTPGFGWGAVPGATSYELQVSTSDTFATLVGTTVTTTNTTYAWTTPALTANTTYYWRVRAITATGTSSYVNGVFTTVPAVTTQPTQQPPVTVTNTTVTLPTPATPAYIWVIIGIGAILVILIIVLIVRTRRTV